MRGDIGDLSRTTSSAIWPTMFTTPSRAPKRRAVNPVTFLAAASQTALLSSGGAAPVLNIFGQNISEAGVDAVGIGATNSTEAELQVAAATLSGQIFDLPAGPLSFSLGAEWRYASSQFVPDEFPAFGRRGGLQSWSADRRRCDREGNLRRVARSHPRRLAVRGQPHRQRRVPHVRLRSGRRGQGLDVSVRSRLAPE